MSPFNPDTAAPGTDFRLTRTAWGFGTLLLLIASFYASFVWVIRVWPVALFALGVGLLLGGLIAGVNRPNRWRVAWIVVLVLPIGFAIKQRLPISNLDAVELGKVESLRLTGPANTSVEVRDPARIAQFLSYVGSGHQGVLWISGFYCEVEIHFQGGMIERKVILGDCIGGQGGGHMQEIFVPEKRGLEAWTLASFDESGVKFR